MAGGKDSAALAKALARELDLALDANLEKAVAMIMKHPVGKQVGEMFDIVLKNPTKKPHASETLDAKEWKAVINSATHKIQLPKRPKDPKKLLQQEIRKSAFCDAVASVVRDIHREKEMEIIAQEEEKQFAEGEFILEPAKVQLTTDLKSAVETSASEMDRFVGTFDQITEPFKHNFELMKAPGSREKNQFKIAPLLDSVTEVVRERVKHFQQKVPELVCATISTTAVGGVKRDKYEETLRSRLDNRVGKIYDRSLSLGDLADDFLDSFSGKKLEDFVNEMQMILMSCEPKVEDTQAKMIAMKDSFVDYENGMEELTVQNNSLDVTVQSLKDSAIKDCEKIVRLSKISFRMRLEAAIQSIIIKAKQDYYDEVLDKARQEQLSLEGMLEFDVDRGEPSSHPIQAEFEAQMRKLLLEGNSEQLALHRLIKDTCQLFEETKEYKVVEVVSALKRVERACSKLCLATQALAGMAPEVQWDQIVDLTAGFSQSEKLKEDIAFLESMKHHPHVTQGTESDLTELKNSIHFREQDLIEQNGQAKLCVERMDIMLGDLLKKKGTGTFVEDKEYGNALTTDSLNTGSGTSALSLHADCLEFKEGVNVNLTSTPISYRPTAKKDDAFYLNDSLFNLDSPA